MSLTEIQSVPRLAHWIKITNEGFLLLQIPYDNQLERGFWMTRGKTWVELMLKVPVRAFRNTMEGQEEAHIGPMDMRWPHQNHPPAFLET
jgi:hypothetical protein